MSKRRLTIMLLLLLPLLTLAGSEDPRPACSRPVRVRLQSLERPANIVGRRLSYSIGGKKFSTESIVVKAEGGSLWVNGEQTDGPLAITTDGTFTVDGVSYRGELRALADPPALLDLIDLDTYVAGVVNHEMDSRWPQAAVDAQTILARTYALKRMEERAGQAFDLDRTVADQVYQGTVGEDERSWAAVERTRGQVLSYQGRLATGLYHSCCGGHTELPSAVWGGSDQPYQVSVECPYCQRAPRYFWRYPNERPLPGAELAALLKMNGEVSAVEVREKTETGRAAMIEVSTGGRSRVLSGQEFRKLIGYDRIWSTAFSVESAEGGFIFRGSGSGHGVGMCQWGARGMAEKGKKATEILKFYFPGAQVVSIGDLER